MDTHGGRFRLPDGSGLVLVAGAVHRQSTTTGRYLSLQVSERA
ncbi:hypothetical protein [Kitasatospora sp. NPDC001095]